MRIGLTGGHGFLGWHLRCRLVLAGHQVVVADRATFASSAALDGFVGDSECIVHAAGVNRGESDDAVADANRRLANDLVSAMKRQNVRLPVIYTNSAKGEDGGSYGTAKEAASKELAAYQQSVGQPYTDLVLPHVFGEFGRPFYNSAVTTFAHCLAAGEEPDVHAAGQLELINTHEVASLVVDAVGSPIDGRCRMEGRSITVGEVWNLLRAQHERYVGGRTIPAFADRFELQLFNTLRSQLDLNGFYPAAIALHADDRGAFAELCRADGTGQTSISTTRPRITRGDHFHLDKIERFVVIGGSATIRLRRLFSTEVRSFAVSGEDPSLIDMAPLTTHNITNTGDDTMTTVFWAGDHFDPAHPDTFAEPVDPDLGVFV